MSTEIKANPVNRGRPSAHEVLLAGIGAMSLIRKNAGAAVTEAFAIAGRVPDAASIAIEGIGESGGRYRDELIARANGLGKRATEVAGNLVSDVESRLQPLLRKFDDVKIGLGVTVLKPKAKPAAARRGRKATKAVVKRKGRKAA